MRAWASTVQDVNQSLADSFGLKRPDGALVANVAPGSAAAKAGLKSGDVIREVNGQPIVALGRAAGADRPGRAGRAGQAGGLARRQAREIDAKLGTAEEQGKHGRRRGQCRAGRPARPGAAPADAARSAREAKVEQGLVVEDVRGRPRGPACSRATCCWPSTASRCSRSTRSRACSAAKPKSVALLVQRDDDKIFVPVRLG